MFIEFFYDALVCPPLSTSVSKDIIGSIITYFLKFYSFHAVIKNSFAASMFQQAEVNRKCSYIIFGQYF